jgi:hypothetical protein
VAAFELTIFAKSDGPLTKRISLGPDGSLQSDGSACRMSVGTARRIRFENLTTFGEILERLGSHEAVALGRLAPELADEVPVVTQKRLKERFGAIARTQEFVIYKKGAPALALVDFDQKGMPCETADRLEQLGGLWGALEAIIPNLRNKGHVLRRSTSAGLYRADTGERLPGSGMHGFLLIRDGADGERFLKDLHARCWLAGLGWLMVGASGQLLERSIVDRVVGGPERLVFEGAPILMAPVAQDPAGRRPSVTEGDALDTVAHCPPLSIRENALFREMRAKQAASFAGLAREARKAFVHHHKARLIAQGVNPAAAARLVERQCDGVLRPDLALPFDDPELAGKTVADVLADPEPFEGATLADPLEGVEYGVCKAKVMLHADGTPWIHSFAHGRTRYELRFDYRAAAAAVSQATCEQATDVFVNCALDGDLTPDEVEQLRDLASTRAGVGKRALMARLKAAKEKRAEHRAAEESTLRIAQRHDRRPQVPAPLPDAPWLPQMQLLEEVLGGDPSDEPPMRDDDGYVIQAIERAVGGLHELTAHGTNASDTKETRLPPPAQLTLARLDRAGLGELIERHIDFVDGDPPRSVHLSGAFVDHYIKRADSTLPVARSITSLPLILPEGLIAAGPGLDRRLRMVFRVPAALRELLPKPEQCTAGSCAIALRFLTHEWLCDVDTIMPGDARSLPPHYQ